MNIPKKVKVGGFDYEIFLTDEELIVDYQQCTGKIDYDQQTIKISKVLRAKQGQEQTFIHELIHAIARDRDLNWGEETEKNTEALANGLYQVIKDNPEIFQHQTNNCNVTIKPFEQQDISSTGDSKSLVDCQNGGGFVNPKTIEEAILKVIKGN